jgi:N-acetylmuramoyl-L-alanine amidase
MSKKRVAGSKKAARRKVIKRGEQTLFSIMIATLLIMCLMMGIELFGSTGDSEAKEVRIPLPELSTGPTVGAMQARDRVVLDENRPLVGIVSGHKGYDPGAVCPDGLTEAQVNHAIALEVANLLNRLGIRTDVLDEFDERLTDYQADALVSVHSDSCNIPGATGYKVARVTDSAIPEAEDQLVSCLTQEYALYTGMSYHSASITDGMTGYHAFREIGRSTPGAIIETGFLLGDRQLLADKPKIVARGIAAGLICFLETVPEDPPP